jgi:hypothetical protein
MLLAAGANPCAVDDRGRTVLEGCWPEYREWLERAVADWNAVHQEDARGAQSRDDSGDGE